MPVDDSHQVHKPPFKPNVRDISAPHLITPIDIQSSEKIGKHLMVWVFPAEIGLGIDRFQPHLPQQPPHAFFIDRMP
jgi:hypothetical protein